MEDRPDGVGQPSNSRRRPAARGRRSTPYVTRIVFLRDALVLEPHLEVQRRHVQIDREMNGRAQAGRRHREDRAAAGWALAPPVPWAFLVGCRRPVSRPASACSPRRWSRAPCRRTAIGLIRRCSASPTLTMGFYWKQDWGDPQPADSAASSGSLSACYSPSARLEQRACRWPRASSASSWPSCRRPRALVSGPRLSAQPDRRHARRRGVGFSRDCPCRWADRRHLPPWRSGCRRRRSSPRTRSSSPSTT